MIIILAILAYAFILAVTPINFVIIIILGVSALLMPVVAIPGIALGLFLKGVIN